MGVRVPLCALLFSLMERILVMPEQWYAASLQSNRELQAEKFFQGQQIEYFLPTYLTVSTRRDRTKMLARPLFPGYIFVHIQIPGLQKVRVLKCPGVCGLVSFSNQPSIISDDVIASLQILTGAQKGGIKPHPLVKSGQRVVVKAGPFKGATGVLSGSENRKQKLVVEVEFLGRAVSVPIHPEQVSPVF